MTVRIRLILLSALMTMPGASMAYPVAGLETNYFTMVNQSVRRSDCNGEGGQIVNGYYYGSNCKPLDREKYCRWGVGNHNNCLIPCVDGAGPRKWAGKIVEITPQKCMYGPFKGLTIRYVRVSDVGRMVRGTHVDLFQGLCMRRSRTDNCLEYADEDNYASIRGTNRYDETQGLVVALLMSMGLDSRVAAMNTPSRPRYAEAQTGTAVR